MIPIRKILTLVLCLVLVLALAPRGYAQEEGAKDLRKTIQVTDWKGFVHRSSLFDKELVTDYPVVTEASLTMHHQDGFGSLYILFDQPCGEYTVTSLDTGKSATLGTYDFLHEYADLEALLGEIPATITLHFPEGAAITEIIPFGPGQVPDYVQKWEPPAEGETDLILFSTHGDDEQLFFAGILPYYAGQLGLNVQVVYLVSHENSIPNRMHEMLDGLYAVGVKNYPVFGSFPDQLSHSLRDGYRMFEYRGITREDLMAFVVENLRRFKPLVAVTHDTEGEYSHGQHMVYADLVMEAVQIASDRTRYPQSANSWGTWDTPKTYLHLYPENPIVMDWDQPLSNFGGMTAFEVTRDLGFPCHKSQYYDFLWYLTQGRKAADLWKYSPCKYGLFRSTVGMDVEKNDFFENLTDYTRPLQLKKRPNLPPPPGHTDWPRERE